MYSECDTTRGWNDELWALLSRRYFALFSLPPSPPISTASQPFPPPPHYALQPHKFSYQILVPDIWGVDDLFLVDVRCCRCLGYPLALGQNSSLQ